MKLKMKLLFGMLDLADSRMLTMATSCIEADTVGATFDVLEGEGEGMTQMDPCPASTHDPPGQPPTRQSTTGTADDEGETLTVFEVDHEAGEADSKAAE